MSPKSVSFLAIALVAILAAPVMSAVADADAGQSSGFYRDQLDANGQGLYDEVAATLAALEEAPVNEAKVSYTMSSVPSTEADAVSYAQSVVSDALAALYLSNPSYVWLWDYPISNVAIGTSSFDPVSGAISVTFSLTVPDRYADDPETEANELAETIADFRDRIETFEGDALSIVRGEDCVILNVLKCRPPGNRNPEPAEIACCTHYLMRQLELLEPKVLFLMGRFASQALIGLEPGAALGRMRGRVHEAHVGGRSIPAVATYHPSYLLRSPDQKAKAWEDLCLLRRVMREAGIPLREKEKRWN